MGSSFHLGVWRGRKVNFYPAPVYSEKDTFEVIATESQGSALDPRAK